MVGKSLGHYEILAPLGSGGMGEVYRARDANLKRDVAIKVLPEDLADDPERLARLEREAHLLAALNHSNIASIYSLEESRGTRFLVMELVAGASLEQILTGGRLPVEEALDICRQIAEALEAAHEQGIIHRDLKPANVLITPDGKAKVLDFGLAKTVERGTTGTDLSHSPTITIAATDAGVIIGTAPYMSPEQVRGKPLDKYADIWAFGCVLYETLTGHRAFSRETVADTLAAILEVEPQWDVLPSDTPPAARALLLRCLRKDSRRRLRDIGDARIEIEEALGVPGAVTAPITVDLVTQPAWGRALPWVFAVVSLAVAVGAVLWAVGTEQRPTLTSGSGLAGHKYSIVVPDGRTLPDSGRDRVIITRDGSRIVYAASAGRLYVHDLDHLEPADPLTGLGATSRFLSADGDWIGFFHAESSELRRVSVNGGAAEKICELPPNLPTGRSFPRSASWARDGYIVFSAGGTLWRVSDKGDDQPVPIAAPDPSAGEISYQGPKMIPGHEAVVFGVFTSATQYGHDMPIAVLDLGTLVPKRLGVTGNAPVVTPTGHLLFDRSGILYAQALDLDALEAYGPQVPVPLDPGLAWGDFGHPSFAISEGGTLAYVPGQSYTGEPLLWLDQEGNTERAIDDLLWIDAMRLSPDGKLVALDLAPFNSDISIYEIGGGQVARVDGGWEQVFSAWMPDNSGFYYYEVVADEVALFHYDLETRISTPFEPWLPAGYSGPRPHSISSDGKTMALDARHPSTGRDILLLQLTGERAAEPWLTTNGSDSRPMFSPDDRLVAYFSNQLGTYDGFVRAVSARDPHRQGTKVATVRTFALAWGTDASALYYVLPADALEIWTVPLGPETEPSIGPPREVLDYGRAFYPTGQMWQMGDDGRALATPAATSVGKINIWLDFFDELNELVPTGR